MEKLLVFPVVQKTNLPPGDQAEQEKGRYTPRFCSLQHFAPALGYTLIL